MWNNCQNYVEKPTAAGLNICIENRCGRGWGAHTNVLEGEKMTSLRLASPLRSSSSSPAFMSPLGSLMDADSNGCPPSPNPSTVPTLIPSFFNSFISPASFSSDLSTQLWTFWSRGLTHGGGATLSEPGCEKAHSERDLKPIQDHYFLMLTYVSHRYRHGTARLRKIKIK